MKACVHRDPRTHVHSGFLHNHPVGAHTGLRPHSGAFLRCGEEGRKEAPTRATTWMNFKIAMPGARSQMGKGSDHTRLFT